MGNLKYEEAFHLVKEELKQALAGSPPIINQYLLGLTRSQGKMLRASAVLICSEDESGLVEPAAVSAAAAIEIIHLASLIHDDVIDDADIRRGQDTIQKKYGRRTAVICGDFLLSLAFTLISKIPDPGQYQEISFPDYIRRLCLGELLQHVNNYNSDLSVLEYIRIISGKTAALFEASFFAGSVLCGCSTRERTIYKKIGKYAGLIFQLQDDCLDFNETMEVAKKPVQSDYEQGVMTLPLIFALGMRPQYKEKAAAGMLTRKEINNIVKETDGVSFNIQMMTKYSTKAIKELNRLDLNENKKNQILEFLHLMTGGYLEAGAIQ
ncbi:MAG: polyprenyl synthetase family protein [Lachnospiraceae bacterium]